MPPKAKPDTAAYQKLKKDIKEGTIGTLYVFHGEEAYLRDFYLGQLKKKLLPAGMEEFNLHTLSGKEFDVKTLAQLVDCLPMMSERTLIVVNDYDIYKGDKDALAAVLRELPDYVCLVFVYDLIEYKADARTKLAALLKEKGSVVPFNRQGQGDLVDWISRRFKAMDHDIGTEDAKYLIFLCGDLMNNLISEIGKIGSYAAHHRVTRQDIDAVATPQLDAVVFQMTDAIAAGNFDKAAEVLGELLHMQEAPIKLLAVLGKQLRQLYTARLAIEHRKGVPYLMELWGMRSAYPAERLMQSARRFSLPWCRRAVLRCGTGPIDVSQRPNYEQLYAQALSALRAGEKTYFDVEQTRLIMANNRKFEVVSPVDQYFDLYFDLTDDAKQGEYLTAAEIFQELKSHIGSSLKLNSLIAFGRKLSQMPTIHRKRFNDGMRYLVVRKS